MHILHTVLYTFIKVLTEKTVYKPEASLVGDYFMYFHGLYDRGEKLDAIYSRG